MDQEPTVHRLTPAIYDFYVARARAARAEAIAAFGGQVAGWFRNIMAPVTGHRRAAHARHVTRAPAGR